jgi:hypothetical protein
MNDPLKPGFESKQELWQSNLQHLKRFCDKHIIPFLKIELGAVCLDIGEKNPRMEYLKEKMDMEVIQYISSDLNFDTVLHKFDPDIIFCFEVMEHLQNPLLLMSRMKHAIWDSGSIYIIIPCNPRWLWHEKHYFEIDRRHFDKWIVKPLGLRIVRYKHITSINWRAYLIGVRPLFKVLTRKTTVRTFLRSLFAVQWTIYEIKKG